MPNDALFGDQWSLENTGQAGGTVDADIDAPQAWDITTGNMLRAVVLAANAQPEANTIRLKSGTFASAGHNLVETVGGSSGWLGSDITGVVPLLGPLADNTGPTPTHDLPVGSPAINFGARLPYDCIGHLRPGGPHLRADSRRTTHGHAARREMIGSRSWT